MNRFSDPWWRSFDKPSDGYRDFTGFVHRLPFRMESSDLVLYGIVDAKSLIEDVFEDELYTPITIGNENKAVISIAFKDIRDTDGGKYYEIFYATYVSKKENCPINVPFKTPFSLLEACDIPATQGFCLSILCGDTIDNPGGAKRGIHCGRDVFGVPKHPNIADLRFNYMFNNNEKETLEFEAYHDNSHVISLHCKLPMREATFSTASLDVPKGKGSVIGAPCYGGVHKGFSGTFQSKVESAVNCTMSISKWNDDHDYFNLGNNEHFSRHLSKWKFQPLVKSYSDDFKICLFKPSGWISGDEAAAAIAEYEGGIN